MIAFLTAVFLAVALTQNAMAAEVYRDTSFFARDEGKMVPVDRIPADVEIVPLKATPDGQWLRVWWKEREGWIRARDVRGVDVNKLRAPAAEADSAEELSAEPNSLRFDLSLAAKAVGIGFGGGYFRRIRALEFADGVRVDVALLGYYFPTPPGGDALQVQLLFRGLRLVHGKFEVGGEIGAFYNRFVGDDPFGLGDNVSNTFGGVLGPTGTFGLTPQLKAVVNVRVLLNETVNTQIGTALEYRF